MDWRPFIIPESGGSAAVVCLCDLNAWLHGEDLSEELHSVFAVSMRGQLGAPWHGAVGG